MPPLHHLHHAPVHQVGRREVFDAVAAQLDAALGDLTALGLEQVGDGPQRGRLARAVASQHGSDLALGHVERNALQHQDHMVVDDLDAVDVENDIGSGAHGVFLVNHLQGKAKTPALQMAAEVSRRDPPRRADPIRGHRGTGFAGPQVSPP
ncbi:hypothetical protein D9M68_805140 [compost metagenome]